MTGVYLAAAIDQDPKGTSDDDVAVFTDWVSSVEGVDWVYNPKHAFRVGASPRITDHIRTINANALEECSVLVAFMPKGVVSVGVPMEIERALVLGKRVVVFSDAESWMLADPRIHRFERFGQESMAEVEQVIRQTDGVAGHVQQDMPVFLQEGARLPTRGHADDAGLDLYVQRDVVIPPGSFMDVPSGVHVEMPDWSWGLLTGRSSTLRRLGLLVNSGVIDAGYRGELFAGVFNLGKTAVEVHEGERLAQLILLENGTARVRPVVAQSLREGSRNMNGFGSTGH